jgi:hypothetical protein
MRAWTTSISVLPASRGDIEGYELFTEDYLLEALSGAAWGYELFTEDYLLGALSGAAGGCGLCC